VVDGKVVTADDVVATPATTPRHVGGRQQPRHVARLIPPRPVPATPIPPATPPQKGGLAPLWRPSITPPFSPQWPSSTPLSSPSPPTTPPRQGTRTVPPDAPPRKRHSGARK